MCGDDPAPPPQPYREVFGTVSPEMGVGFMEEEWVIGQQDFQGQIQKPDRQVPTGPLKPASLLALLPFPALLHWPHPCSLLAEPDRSPGRAEIQGPYLPGGIQHTVSRLGTAVGLPSFQRQGCPVSCAVVGGGLLPGVARIPGHAGQGKAGWRGQFSPATYSLVASFMFRLSIHSVNIY